MKLMECYKKSRSAFTKRDLNIEAVIYMDFNVPAGQQFAQFNPINGFTTNKTVFESTRNLFGNTYLEKGFEKPELNWSIRKWIDGFGVEPLGDFDKRIEQVLQFYENDSIYFEFGYKPDFSIFTPVLETSSFNFNFNFDF